ncbi:hypothetical protein [Actinomadura sp. B10D3]|uniref:hypothetical protein n=1 Tax=Actinomadura sp. B10D3 TaxID=3153557 RepID=UPI00325EC539
MGVGPRGPDGPAARAARCFHFALADYYCRVQGWTLLREVDRRGRTGYIMSRPAERQPDLLVRTATAPIATGGV